MAVGDRTQLGGTAYDRLRILTTCRTIAMVGLWADPPSQRFRRDLSRCQWLQDHSHQPKSGREDYSWRTRLCTRSEIDHPVDIVNVFVLLPRCRTSPDKQ